MSTHYLIDQFGNPIANSGILDIIQTSTGTSPLAGNFVVRVPDGLSVQRPTDLNDLLTKKYAALLAYYTNFTNIAYDDLLDASGVQAFPNGHFKVTMGDRSSLRLNEGPVPGPFSWVTVSNPGNIAVPLAIVPAQVIITWETFAVLQSDPKTGAVERTYQEVSADPANTLVWVTFNNGATWIPAFDGAIMNIAPVDQGNQFMFYIENQSAGPIHVGSWALLY